MMEFSPQEHHKA